MARGDVYYPLHCYSLSHLVPSLLRYEPHAYSRRYSQPPTAACHLFPDRRSCDSPDHLLRIDRPGDSISIHSHTSAAHSAQLHPHRRRRGQRLSPGLCEGIIALYAPLGQLCHSRDVWSRAVWHLQVGWPGDSSLRSAIISGQISVKCNSQKNQICALL